MILRGNHVGLVVALRQIFGESSLPEGYTSYHSEVGHAAIIFRDGNIWSFHSRDDSDFDAIVVGLRVLKDRPQHTRIAREFAVRSAVDWILGTVSNREPWLPSPTVCAYRDEQFWTAVQAHLNS
jgi:hypothetical protein